MNREQWDAVIVGGGPAGLSAALWLARYRRRAVIIDDDEPRNEAAWAVHGYPGFPDPRPDDLRRKLGEQARTAGASMDRGRVSEVRGEKGDFIVTEEGGRERHARRILLAYGRTDRLPDLAGLPELYGTSVFHCPDCDGPSIAGCNVGVIGHNRSAAGLALYLLTWAPRVTLLTNGLEPDLTEEARATLQRQHVAIRTERIVRLKGVDGQLEQVDVGGAPLELDALFFHWGTDPASTLAQRTGCECESSGDIRVQWTSMETSVPGIYAAGDIVGHPHLAITAAAQGVQAALAIHRSLLPAEFAL